MKSENTVKKRFKAVLIILMAVVAVVAITLPSIAYYIRTATGGINDNYEPATPATPELKSGEPQIQSFALDANSNSIQNVTIKVYADHPVFLRAAIIVSWQREAPCTCEKCLLCYTPCTCEDCEGRIVYKDCAECNCESEECTSDEMCVFCTDCVECEGDEEHTYCAGCDECTELCDCTECKDDDGHKKACEDCQLCPRCNEDEEDDWDIFFTAPVIDVDYEMDMDSSWELMADKDDNSFYYYTDYLLGNNNETILFNSFALIEPEEDEYEASLLADGWILHLEIIVQTIQAIGFTDEKEDENGNIIPGTAIPAWEDAWGITSSPFN